MSKILSIVHNAMWIVFFASLSVNIAAVCIYIQHNRQVGEPDNKVEQSITTAASTVTAASGFIESGNNKLNDVTAGLQSSKDTARAITDSTGTSIKRCRDAEETITELRKEVQDLEKCVNHNDSDINNSNNNTNSEEIN